MLIAKFRSSIVGSIEPQGETVELELFVSGIGGQGVQLIGKTIALAALREGRHVMLAGEYGGHMRGGSSVVTVVIGPEPVRALPTLPEAGMAIAMSHSFWEKVGPRLRPGSLILAEETIAAQLPDEGHTILRVPAIALGTQAGNRLASSMAMMGVFSELTGAVGIPALEAAMEEQLPPYRRQHAGTNATAIRLGGDYARDTFGSRRHPAPYLVAEVA